jgi:FkbM family methyltransferase
MKTLEPIGCLASCSIAPAPQFFIQIGAGAGDQDSRAGFRDGFTELIKSQNLTAADRIILVEPNPFNIPALGKCWEKYSIAEIHQVGIVEKNIAGISLPFYFTELDAPHFQVASFNPQHVLKHYRELDISDLTKVDVSTIDLSSFVQQVTNGSTITLLALDIEGLDSEVILDTDFSAINVRLVSFEHLHLGASKLKVQHHFDSCGFEMVGPGVDHNGYDWLYRKTTGIV